MHQAGYQQWMGTASPPVSWFQTDSGHFLFNTQIQVLKRSFSGLMVVKRLRKDAYRAVFMTETGLKLFDMEFDTVGQIKIHYVMDALNRKALLKPVSRDLELVFMNGLADLPVITFKKNDNTSFLFRYLVRNQHRDYYTRVGEEQPYLIMQNAGLKPRTQVICFGNQHDGLDSLAIRNYCPRMQITLYRIIEVPYVAE
jgi:hypothetical protein